MSATGHARDGVIVCKPGDPEAKGLVERANQYLDVVGPAGRGDRVGERATAGRLMWRPYCRAAVVLSVGGTIVS
jgi:hypothetical protein